MKTIVLQIIQNNRDAVSGTSCFHSHILFTCVVLRGRQCCQMWRFSSQMGYFLFDWMSKSKRVLFVSFGRLNLGNFFLLFSKLLFIHTSVIKAL